MICKKNVSNFMLSVSNKLITALLIYLVHDNTPAQDYFWLGSQHYLYVAFFNVLIRIMN